MEQPDRSRANYSDLSAREAMPAHEQTGSPPLTFAEAEQHNAFSLLIELHDHSLTRTVQAERPEQAAHHLAELALASAVVAWWSRWQPISMHRAFVASASLSEVAAAAGVSELEAYGRWTRWAVTQAGLELNGKSLLDPAELAAVRARIRPIDQIGEPDTG